MAHDPALEAAILADRDDPETYLVYGDWLASRGDPRGELIAVQHRADRIEPGNRELLAYRDDYLRRHPQLVPALVPWRTRYRWRWGFIEHASLEDPVPGELRALLEHPSCRLLRELELVTPRADTPALVRELLGVTRPTLESVTIEQGPRRSGDPDAAPWSRLPRLGHLAVGAAGALCPTLAHPTLRSLHIPHGDPFGSEPPWDLPAVAAVSWGTSSDPDRGSPDREPAHLGALWSAHLPSLRRLDLGSCDVRPIRDEPGLLEHDGFLRLLPGLDTLRIRLTAIRRDEAAAVEQLRRQAARLAHLRELHVTASPFGAYFVEQLREQLPSLRLAW